MKRESEVMLGMWLKLWQRMSGSIVENFICKVVEIMCSLEPTIEVIVPW
jgi:hypothetical protein